jgi:hypothetical protein
MHSHHQRCAVNYGGPCNCGFTTAAPCALAPALSSPLEVALLAILRPVIQQVHAAGVDRFSVERDGSVILQMQTGTVIGPIKP